MSGPLRWDVVGPTWPHRETSRFVEAGDLTWHVQSMGEGSPVLLLHGTGASTHSWRDIMPRLAENFRVIAPDLPGHGFTRGHLRGGPTLPNVARAIADLLRALNVEPALASGHSAGAAIVLRMALDGSTAPVVGFDAALMPFPGLGSRLFPALAKALFVNPFVPSIFARMARVPGETGRFLVRATGSHVDATGVRCYQTLLANSRHCAGALAMMASWDLEGLKSSLPRIPVPVLLAHGTRDAAIPIDSVREAASLLPDCRVQPLDGLGHLAHEEQPAMAAELIERFAEECGIERAKRRSIKT